MHSTSSCATAAIQRSHSRPAFMAMIALLRNSSRSLTNLAKRVAAWLGKTKTPIFGLREKLDQHLWYIIRRKNVEQPHNGIIKSKTSEMSFKIKGISSSQITQRKSGQKVNVEKIILFPTSSSPMLDRVFLLGWPWMHSILQWDAIEYI